MSFVRFRLFGWKREHAAHATLTRWISKTSARKAVATTLALVAAGPARAGESRVAPGWATALSSLPLSEARRTPTRRLGRAEVTCLRAAVDYVFADADYRARRQIFRRVSNHAATTPRPEARTATRENLLDVTVECVERAAERKAAGDKPGTRDQVTAALAAIGWAYRTVWETPGATFDTKGLKQLLVYAAAMVSSLASVASVVGIADMPTDDPRQVLPLLYAFAQFFVDIILVVDLTPGTYPVVAEFLGRPFIFVDAWADRIEAREKVDRFWFDVEARLAENEEWRRFVSTRERRTGAKGIAGDVREYLRHLLGARTLGPACDELLAPNATASPFR